MRLLFCIVALALPLAAQVKITNRESREIAVEIDGKPFTVFHIGPETNKPYLAPIHAASGTIVTRGFPMEKIEGENQDHPHHRGLWFTHGEVNGYDFWANEESQKGVGKGKGQIVLKKVNKVSSGKNSGEINTVFDWTAGGKPILSESRRMVFRSAPELRMIDFDITLKALDKVTFGDTKEGTFAIRLAAELEEAQPKKIAAPVRTGRMVASTGKETEKQVWGSRAAWVDYYGTIKGEALGLALMDHPGNPRHPTYWHSRAYGLFAANPFGVSDFERDKSNKGEMTLEPGQSLRFRYRLVIHPGDAKSADVAALYKQYAAK